MGASPRSGGLLAAITGIVVGVEQALVNSLLAISALYVYLLLLFALSYLLLVLLSINSLRQVTPATRAARRPKAPPSHIPPVRADLPIQPGSQTITRTTLGAQPSIGFPRTRTSLAPRTRREDWLSGRSAVSHSSESSPVSSAYLVSLVSSFCFLTRHIYIRIVCTCSSTIARS